MVKEGETTWGAFWRYLFSLGFYKRSQGQVARRATFLVLAVVVTLAGWSLLNYLAGRSMPFTGSLLIENSTAEQSELAKHRKDLHDAINSWAHYAIPMALVFGGYWLAFRAVNIPRFADFLIAVEAEMNKVSWPSRGEMFRSAVVVIVTIFGLAFLLFGYDVMWQFLLDKLGVI